MHTPSRYTHRRPKPEELMVCGGPRAHHPAIQRWSLTRWAAYRFALLRFAPWQPASLPSCGGGRVVGQASEITLCTVRGLVRSSTPYSFAGRLDRRPDQPFGSSAFVLGADRYVEFRDWQDRLHCMRVRQPESSGCRLNQLFRQCGTDEQRCFLWETWATYSISQSCSAVRFICLQTEFWIKSLRRAEGKLSTKKVLRP